MLFNDAEEAKTRGNVGEGVFPAHKLPRLHSPEQSRIERFRSGEGGRPPSPCCDQLDCLLVGGQSRIDQILTDIVLELVPNRLHHINPGLTLRSIKLTDHATGFEDLGPVLRVDFR